MKYELLKILRKKQDLFWILAFPIILSTLFKIAFGNLYENTEVFTKIPIAVVSDESMDSVIFQNVVESLSQGDNAMFDTTFTDNESAEKMLFENDIDAIIYSDIDGIKMSVTKKNGGNQSIVKSFTDSFIAGKSVIESGKTDISEFVKNMNSEISYNKEVTANRKENDPYVTYFYNIIAMICIFASTLGLAVINESTAAFSDKGARISVSPVKRSSVILKGLISALIVNYACMLVVLMYILFVLKVSFGDDIHMVLFASFIGTVMGTGFGVFIGSVLKVSRGIKEALCTGISLIMCFMSGLMLANIPMIIYEKCPVLNKLNPVAMLCDCFYSLTVFESYERFFENIIKMSVTTLIFVLLSLIFSARRNKRADF
ncbi:MAG: ABC transporter permease [Oscillospiraceae bacterium]|nr:ABC transporter permease [Oscillospiraceae bacterium]